VRRENLDDLRLGRGSRLAVDEGEDGVGDFASGFVLCSCV
jgi:hypothetical protein